MAPVLGSVPGEERAARGALGQAGHLDSLTAPLENFMRDLRASEPIRVKGTSARSGRDWRFGV